MEKPNIPLALSRVAGLLGRGEEAKGRRTGQSYKTITYVEKNKDISAEKTRKQNSLASATCTH